MKMKNYSDDTVTAGESGPHRVNCGWLRLALLMLAGLMTVLAAALASAQAKPDLVVSSVLEPVPPGAQPGGGMFLQATVKAGNGKGQKATVVFYLSKDSVPGVDIVEIASTTAGGFDDPDTVGVAGHVPPGVPPGFYFVVACAGGGNCAVSRGTIHVVGQALSTVNQSPVLTSKTHPPEYFPENPADGMSVGSPFPCPFSFHGQWPGSCVFVTTRVFKYGPFDAEGLNYCTRDHRYPYEVAIGFDALWNDLGKNPAMTNVVSFTKYRQDSGDSHYESYGGLDPSDSAQRGYVWFFWDQVGQIDGQAQFLCTNQPSTSAAP